MFLRAFSFSSRVHKHFSLLFNLVFSSSRLNIFIFLILLAFLLLFAFNPIFFPFLHAFLFSASDIFLFSLRVFFFFAFERNLYIFFFLLLLIILCARFLRLVHTCIFCLLSRVFTFSRISSSTGRVFSSFSLVFSSIGPVVSSYSRVFSSTMRVFSSFRPYIHSLSHQLTRVLSLPRIHTRTFSSNFTYISTYARFLYIHVHTNIFSEPPRRMKQFIIQYVCV